VFWVQVVLTGIALGSIYALAGIGLVLTYKATGIFNFAHGAIAMIVAYSLWEARERWHFPLWIAAIWALLVVGPGIGLLLERFVFRSLQRRRASTSEKLVATLGVFLALLGLAYEIWTGEVRTEPRIISNRPLHLPGKLIIGADQLAVVILVIVVSAALWAMFRFTAIGVEIKAVVDRRELAELSSINADRVAGLSWAMGCGLAGLTGVLLAAQEGLDPYHLTLLVIETFSIAVVAGLTSLPIAVGAGIVILGVGNELLLQFHPHVLPLLHTHLPSAITNSIDELKPNLSVLVLFLGLLVLRNLDEPSDDVTGRRGLISASVGRVNRLRASSVASVSVLLVAAALIPFALGTVGVDRAQITLALVVIFVSIVCTTGYCGYITLGQAGFAGFGAFVSARAADWYHLPVIVGTLVGGLGAMLLGVIAGYPALRRRGLFLGLTTLSIGLLAYNFVFTNDTFHPSSARMNRPDFAVGLHGFYWYELAWVLVILLLARNLRSGRLGRILGAMGDSEVAAEAVGINLPRYKLLVFALSAFIAGIGGTLLAQQAQVFSGLSFDPLTSLEWFTVVIVAGVGSLEGAVLGAFVFELLDVFLPGHQSSTIIIAVGALGLAYLPGGSLTGMRRKAAEFITTPIALQRAVARARRTPPPRPVAEHLVASPFARRVVGADHE
jgi:branched-chain amino acid transport system permease protein